MEGWQDISDDEELFPGLDERAQGGWFSPPPQPGEQDSALMCLLVSGRTGVLDCSCLSMHTQASSKWLHAFCFQVTAVSALKNSLVPWGGHSRRALKG